MLKQGGAQVDKERPAPQIYDFEMNDKGERVVKEAILDLAVNFPGQLGTHCVCSGEAHNQWEKVAACGTMGEEDKVRGYKGKALLMVVETFGVGESAQPLGDGSGTGSAVEAGAARVARHAEASALVCDGGREPAGFG